MVRSVNSSLQLVALISIAYAGAFAPAFGATFTYNTGNYTTFTDPSSTWAGTVATGINNSGQITGYYFDGTGAHGFLKNGSSYSTFDNPSAPGSTAALGINDAGQIVGSSNAGAFLYDKGVFTNLSVPNYASAAYGINNSAQIVGYYLPVPPGAGSQFQGFFFQNGSGGAYSTLNNMAFGINNAGQIVGGGFVYQNGVYTVLNDPLASRGTSAMGINNIGQIIGLYWTGTNNQNYQFHNFVYSDGIFTTLDNLPNGAQVEGINDFGQIVGVYTDGQSQNQASFLLNPDVTAAVPEPSTWAMMLLGFAGVGFVAYRRKSKPPLVTA